MVLKLLEGETFLIPKLAMKICGTWPSDRPKLGASIVFAISSTLKGVYVVTELINPFGNTHHSISIIQLLVQTTYSFLLVLSVRMNSGRIFRLIQSKIDNWSEVTNLKDQQIMKFRRTFGKIFFVVATPFYFVTPTVLEISFYSYGANDEGSNNRQMTLKDHYMWDLMTLVLRILMNIHYALEEYGILMLFWILNIHISKEFKILKTQFESFLRMQCKERSHQAFRRIVDRHHQLLELSDDLKNAFFVFLTVEVFGIQIWACDQAYQLAVGINNGKFMDVVAISVTIGMGMWLLFMLYNSGEFLTTSSGEIADLLYQCDWYHFPKESRTNFGIVILRCRMPVTFKVGGCFKLNHANYKRMVETLYSYISIILAITKSDV